METNTCHAGLLGSSRRYCLKFLARGRRSIRSSYFQPWPKTYCPERRLREQTWSSRPTAPTSLLLILSLNPDCACSQRLMLPWTE